MVRGISKKYRSFRETHKSIKKIEYVRTYFWETVVKMEFITPCNICSDGPAIGDLCSWEKKMELDVNTKCNCCTECRKDCVELK